MDKTTKDERREPRQLANDVEYIGVPANLQAKQQLGKGELAFVPVSVVVINPSSSTLLVSASGRSGNGAVAVPVPAESMMVFRWLDNQKVSWSLAGFNSAPDAATYSAILHFTEDALQPGVWSIPKVSQAD